jgi:hypothetical protein
MPIEHRHEWICDQVIANAMLDRVMQIHHRFILKGKSMRRKNPPAKEKIDNYFKSISGPLVASQGPINKEIQDQKGEFSRNGSSA